MLNWIKRHAAIIALAMLSAGMILFPAPECFDCEGAAPYGIDTAVVAHRADTIAILYLSAIFLAGLFKIRHAWIIPHGFLIADILTQHFAGVPWWSLRANEGPFIVFCDLIAGLLLLSFSFLCRKCLDWLRESKPPKIAV